MPTSLERRSTVPTLSARERLLQAADELFYGEGVLTVGIDRVIERAGVAKATLYSAFGSKEELIRSYLERRNENRQRRLGAGLDRFDDPRDKLLGVFDVQAEIFADPDYRGCAFLNASAECPRGSAIEQASDRARAWMRSLFTDLAARAGVAEPEVLAARLVLLYDGAMVSARMDRNLQAAAEAKAIAGVLLDRALALG